MMMCVHGKFKFNSSSYCKLANYYRNMHSCRTVFAMIFTTVFLSSNLSSSAYPTMSESTNQRSPFTISQRNRNAKVENPRLSLVEWDQYNERDVKGRTYAFGYDVQNPETDDTHFRHEERLANGTVVGSYGYVTPDGNVHIVKYVADHLGYRAKVETVKRLADVKPIPVNVDQALADELESAQQLYDEYNKNSPIQRRQQEGHVDNRKGQIYVVKNNLAKAMQF